MCYGAHPGSAWPERLLIAPPAPSSVLADIGDPAQYAQLDARFREIWLNTYGSVATARLMFPGYPAFRQHAEPAAPLADGATGATEMPTLRTPEDRYAAVTGLRILMENSAQLLYNAVAR